METFSALLALSVGNSQVTGEFPAHRPVTWSFDVFFELCLNKWLSKQSWCWWFKTASRSLWHHCNVIQEGGLMLHCATGVTDGGAWVKISPPGQNGCHFADNIFRCIFVSEKSCILMKISLKFVSKCPIDNKWTLLQVMAWRRIGDKPFPELMLTQFNDAYMWH